MTSVRPYAARPRSAAMKVAAGLLLSALVAALFGYAAQQRALATQQSAALGRIRAEQTATALIHEAAVSAAQTGTAEQAARDQAQAQQTAQAQETATAVAQRTALARATVTAAQQRASAARAAAQETAVMVQAEATSTAALVQRAERNAAIAASAASIAPPYVQLGTWSQICVLRGASSDETVSYASDDGWANAACALQVGLPGNGTFSQVDGSPANRPGFIQCAFSEPLSSAGWMQFFDFANPPSGLAQIAIRASSARDAAADCLSLMNVLTGAGGGGASAP